MQNNTETPTNNATQTDSGEKLFTQEQVNQIVSERLARERGKVATEQAAADKASDIARREQVLKCRTTSNILQSYWKFWTHRILTASKRRRTRCLKPSPIWAAPSRQLVQMHPPRPHVLTRAQMI